MYVGLRRNGNASKKRHPVNMYNVIKCFSSCRDHYRRTKGTSEHVGEFVDRRVCIETFNPAMAKQLLAGLSAAVSISDGLQTLEDQYFGSGSHATRRIVCERIRRFHSRLAAGGLFDSVDLFPLDNYSPAARSELQSFDTAHGIIPRERDSRAIDGD